MRLRRYLRGYQDLCNPDELVVVVVAVEEGLLPEDHGGEHTAQAPHIQAVDRDFKSKMFAKLLNTCRSLEFTCSRTSGSQPTALGL